MQIIPQKCHREPVTDVCIFAKAKSGVAIRFLISISSSCFWEKDGLPRQCAHWLAMTRSCSHPTRVTFSATMSVRAAESRTCGFTAGSIQRSASASERIIGMRSWIAATDSPGARVRMTKWG